MINATLYMKDGCARHTPYCEIDYGRMDEKKAPRKKKRSRSRIRRKKTSVVIEKETWPDDKVRLTILKFSACTQCGYFLTSYRAAIGSDSVKQLIMQSEHNWIDLGWHDTMPKLLYHAYQLTTDGTPTFLEHCCPECHRVISIQEIQQQEDAAAITNLAIQIMPD